MTFSTVVDKAMFTGHNTASHSTPKWGRVLELPDHIASAELNADAAPSGNCLVKERKREPMRFNHHDSPRGISILGVRSDLLAHPASRLGGGLKVSFAHSALTCCMTPEYGRAGDGPSSLKLHFKLNSHLDEFNSPILCSSFFGIVVCNWLVGAEAAGTQPTAGDAGSH
jgi:hypothetical protein